MNVPVPFPTALTLIAALTMYGCATSNDDIRMVGVVFDPGAESIEISDEITGPESVMYRFEGEPGETLEVTLRTDDQEINFVLYAPGPWPGEEMFNSRTSGRRDYEGELYLDGMHAVQVTRTGTATGAEPSARYELVITKR